MEKSLNRATLVTLVVVAALLGHTGATTYVVGGSLGWTFPPNATTYAAWASQYTFTVGDVLVFNFTTNFHTVATVTKPSFDTCTLTNPISLTTTGPASIPLTTPGEVYFLCTIGQHCAFGSQKFAINVTASSSSPPASPPSSITPTPSPLPETPSPTTTPPAIGPGGPAPTIPVIPPSTNSPPPVASPPPSSIVPPTPTLEVSPPPSSIVPPTPPPPSAATRLGLASIFSIFISVGVCLLF
ncbi:hypothetical protein Leryth_026036 [Lithospermum erythrorhizon]|nr:hypothetical protein Leryth_026036 [Lithospermum erythrorhizon]